MKYNLFVCFDEPAVTVEVNVIRTFLIVFLQATTVFYRGILKEIIKTSKAS